MKWTIYKVFIEFVTTLLLFYALVLFFFFDLETCGILSSSTRDQTHSLCTRGWSRNHWDHQRSSKCQIFNDNTDSSYLLERVAFWPLYHIFSHSCFKKCILRPAELGQYSQLLAERDWMPQGISGSMLVWGRGMGDVEDRKCRGLTFPPVCTDAWSYLAETGTGSLRFMSWNRKSCLWKVAMRKKQQACLASVCVFVYVCVHFQKAYEKWENPASLTRSPVNPSHPQLSSVQLNTELEALSRAYHKNW